MTSCWSGCTYPSGGGGSSVVKIKCLECIIQGILNISIRLAGVAILVMFIIGGFKWLTAGGDPKATAAARNTLTYAVLGLVLLILGWFIFLFIKEFTGVDVLNVRIGP